MHTFTLRRHARGATATEYGLLLTLLGGLTVSAVFALAQDTARPFDMAASSLASAARSAGGAGNTGAADPAIPDGAGATPPDDAAPPRYVLSLPAEKVDTDALTTESVWLDLETHGAEPGDPALLSGGTTINGVPMAGGGWYEHAPGYILLDTAGGVFVLPGFYPDDPIRGFLFRQELHPTLPYAWRPIEGVPAAAAAVIGADFTLPFDPATLAEFLRHVEE